MVNSYHDNNGNHLVSIYHNHVFDENDILDHFHHGHENRVDHCGEPHPRIDYKIEHLNSFHVINKPIAIGHDKDRNEVKFHFPEPVPGKPGWYILDTGYRVKVTTFNVKSKER